MVSDLKQLEINVNLHALQPGFENLELHYILAKDESNFRFVDWNEQPASDEQKYYCFLCQKELFIPAGSITLRESYMVRDHSLYPLVQTAEDFINTISSLEKADSKKCVRQFPDDHLEVITTELEKNYGTLQKHMVQSDEAKHLLLVVDDVEVSISETMVYFRHRAPFSLQHYEHVKEQ